MFLGILLRAEGKRTPETEKMPEAAGEAIEGGQVKAGVGVTFLGCLG